MSDESLRVLEWATPPQQVRTRQALSRMLDVAEALVAEKGFDETAINEIAQRSGSSVGGFYRRFRDKQGLLQALHERFCEQARATSDMVLEPARWADSTTAEIVAEFSAFLVRTYREREGSFRAFLLCGVNDPAVRERTRDLFAHLEQQLTVLLTSRTAEIGHPDPKLAIPFALHLLLASLNHAVQLQSGALGLADERLPGELCRAFLAYLDVRATDH